MACAVSPVHLAVRIERHGHGCEPSADSGRAGTSTAAPVARVLAEYCPYWFESVSGAPIGHRRLARVSTLQRTRIQQAKCSVYVQDLGSVNGTHVNGEQLDMFVPQRLVSGDSVTLGVEATFCLRAVQRRS